MRINDLICCNGVRFGRPKCVKMNLLPGLSIGHCRPLTKSFEKEKERRWKERGGKGRKRRKGMIASHFQIANLEVWHGSRDSWLDFFGAVQVIDFLLQFLRAKAATAFSAF